MQRCWPFDLSHAAYAGRVERVGAVSCRQCVGKTGDLTLRPMPMATAIAIRMIERGRMAALYSTEAPACQALRVDLRATSAAEIARSSTRLLGFGPAQGLDLAGEDGLEAEVVARSGQCRAIGAQGDGGERSPPIFTTNSVAMCCASAALPPLPKNRSLPPPRRLSTQTSPRATKAARRAGRLGDLLVGGHDAVEIVPSARATDGHRYSGGSQGFKLTPNLRRENRASRLRNPCLRPGAERSRRGCARPGAGTGARLRRRRRSCRRRRTASGRCRIEASTRDLRGPRRCRG